MSTAGDIAREAARIIDGCRGSTHGPIERGFETAAALWSAYLGFAVSPSQVAQCMVLLKIARSKHGAPNHRDHYVDGAGYSALAGELAMTTAPDSPEVYR